MKIGQKVRVEYSSYKGDIYREVENNRTMTGTIADITENVFTVLGYHSCWEGRGSTSVPTKEAFMLSDLAVKRIKVVSI